MLNTRESYFRKLSFVVLFLNVRYLVANALINISVVLVHKSKALRLRQEDNR